MIKTSLTKSHTTKSTKAFLNVHSRLNKNITKTSMLELKMKRLNLCPLYITITFFKPENELSILQTIAKF